MTTKSPAMSWKLAAQPLVVGFLETAIRPVKSRCSHLTVAPPSAPKSDNRRGQPVTPPTRTDTTSATSIDAPAAVGAMIRARRQDRGLSQ